MERYTVKFYHQDHDPDQDTELAVLVPLTSTSPVSALVAEARRRAVKLLSRLAEADLIPHYGKENGPILDGDDILGDTIRDPKNEVIFMTTRITQPLNAVEEFSQLQRSSDGVRPDCKNLKIRVITPALAKEHNSTKTIPLLDDGTPFADSTTLYELKARISHSLGIPIQSIPATEGYRECNCAFARQILSRSIWKKIDCSTHTSAALPEQNHIDCRFYSPRTQSLMSELICAICSDTIFNHQTQECNSADQLRDGCNSIFIRSDTACKHVLHRRCLQSGKTWNCPSNCQTMKPEISDELNTGSSRFIVVYDQSQVESINVDSCSKTSLLAALHNKFGFNIGEVKSVEFHQGLYESETDQYVIMPVVSICSRTRHTEIPDKKDRNISPSESAIIGKNSADSRSSKDLDLHTFEGQIMITDLNLTISQINFDDCIIDDVLDIYVVERWANSPVNMDAGKDKIFTISDHWKIPVEQTERGMAAFLSSLRVFTELVNARQMGQSAQDHILHLIHVLTKFPPAIRSMFILMQGKSPTPADCAAMVHAFFETLKDIVTLESIEGDERRYLEGSRLLFGYLLATAKARSEPDDQRKPYLESFKTIDLLNPETRQPIVNPVETSIGLVEKGYYEAYREGGILSWSNGEEPVEARSIDQQTRRLALLCCGLQSEVTALEWGLLNKLLQVGNLQLLFNKPSAFSDMNGLAAYCERNGLAVVLPSALLSSQAPALTLDRDCFQAVYVGRQPCGEPGKDITIFRPTKAKEENVDVAIITQIIAPILKARETERCAIFDLNGEALKRKERTPDEILIFTVDCSSSMNDPCDFIEFSNTDEEDDKVDDDDTDYDDEWGDEYGDDLYQEEDEDEGDDEYEIFKGAYPEAESDDDNDIFQIINLDKYQKTSVDQEASGLTLHDTKQLLLDNESFDDMMAIIQQERTHRRHRAFEILKQLVVMYKRELAHHAESLKLLKDRLTTWHKAHNARKCSQHEDRISWLESAIEGISRHKLSLLYFMKARARRWNIGSRDWVWKSGQAVPNRPTSMRIAAKFESESFCIPPDFICPIQNEVFEDPVIASDGFTYERKAIERWFQLDRSSPLTGLKLMDMKITRNGPLADKINTWIAGESFDERQSHVSKRRRSTRSSVEPHIEILFVGPLSSFSRKIPLSLSVKDLYRVAFQGMKGLHFYFDLRHNGTFLSRDSLEKIQQRSLDNKSIVYIDLRESHKSNILDRDNEAGTKAKSQELALIKVYMGTKEHLFSFWISQHTTQSLASIIFRFWRYNVERMEELPLGYEFDVWTNLRYLGDNKCRGSMFDHWEKLCSLLRPRYATGILADEEVFEKESSQGTESLVGSKSAQEKPLVLKLSLCRPKLDPHKKNAKRRREFSRLDVSKQIFDSFINRTLAYDFSVHIGLITFNSTANISQEITHAVENFRMSLDGMSAAGDTALWDAIALADDQLSQYGRRYPNAMKRIICLSDGADTKSSKRSHEVSLGIIQRKVVVDSFCLGKVDNKELQTTSHVSGGYKFFPKSLEQAMAICEMEPVLSQLERPPIRRNPFSPFNPRRSFEEVSFYVTPDVVTQDVYPARKEHENLKDSFVMISTLAQSSRQSTTASKSAPEALKTSNTRSTRLLLELKNVTANPHPYYEVFVSERNMGFWKVIMQGPPESDYGEGVFLLYLHMEDNYPAFPPKGRFCTPIFHPNINRHGRICHSILDRNWTVDTTNVQILNTIYSLLLVPEFSDPINTVVTLNYHWDQVAFQNEVKKHIEKHAIESRDVLRAKVLSA